MTQILCSIFCRGSILISLRKEIMPKKAMKGPIPWSWKLEFINATESLSWARVCKLNSEGYCMQSRDNLVWQLSYFIGRLPWLSEDAHHLHRWNPRCCSLALIGIGKELNFGRYNGTGYLWSNNLSLRSLLVPCDAYVVLSSLICLADKNEIFYLIPSRG